jgi:hypothetical protein
LNRSVINANRSAPPYVINCPIELFVVLRHNANDGGQALRDRRGQSASTT